MLHQTKKFNGSILFTENVIEDCYIKHFEVSTFLTQNTGNVSFFKKESLDSHIIKVIIYSAEFISILSHCQTNISLKKPGFESTY